MSLRPYLVTLVQRAGGAEIANHWAHPRFILARGPRDALDRLDPSDITPWGDYYATVQVRTLIAGLRLDDCPVRKFHVHFDRSVRSIEEAKES